MGMDDPSATYRGYRRQALYALFRLFDDSLPKGCVIQPEGSEDLAIYDSAGSLIEIVQVKDHSDNLTVSSFKPLFYERIVPFCAKGSRTIVRIVSYGPIGPDLQNTLSGEPTARSRVLKTLTKYRAQVQMQSDSRKEPMQRIPEAEAREIIDHIKLTPVVEEGLTNAIIHALSSTVTGVNPQQAFEFLMWWLLTSSETRLRIDRSKAIDKIGRIGKFLSQRAAYHSEWHTTIVPIAPSLDANACDTSLVEEFYRGGRVRFDHVSMDLDVPRDLFLKNIHAGFDSSNVVVIHSASGQGKTTLSYRYAKEFAASDFRLEVLTSSDLRHARQVALALMGHTEAVEVPTLIFLDVRPGDNYWIEVVRALASVVGIRILVAIREEDWTRSRISAADFSFTEVQLSLEKNEAEAIYNRLIARIGHSRHLDFEDAWSQFGERKTLFEFVYFVTQEESLAGRISTQVEALQDSVIRGDRGEGELELLRLVSVASAYETRLNLKKLLDCCELVAPQRTIELFNNEYLIRVSGDGRIIEGYHSLRSEIIARKLTDPVVHPWSEAASRILPLIVEEDLLGFLLCAFSRNPNASKSLIAALDGFRPRTWVGIHGVATSLIWNGVKEYSEQNSSLFEEVFKKVNSGWYFILDWDLAQVRGKDGIKCFEELENISAKFADEANYARSVKARQSDKDAVFSDMRRWLENFTEQPKSADNVHSFITMGELMFWLGHLQINSSLSGAITREVLDQAHEKLPLYKFGEFVLGLRTCASEIYQDWLNSYREDFVNHLRREANILKLDQTDESVVAHYAIDLDRQSSVLRSRGDSSIAAEATIHDLTIERVELLRNVFPGKKQYGAIGYGHLLSLFALPWDDANKPGVHAENLHAKLLTRLNSVALGYAELKYRPENWADYFELLHSLREKVLAAFDDLRQSISMLKDTSTVPCAVSSEKLTEWNELYREVRQRLLLPKVAVDEWGFITESSIANTVDSRIERYSGLQRLSPLRQAVDEYTTSVGNFMSQALNCLLLVPNLRVAKSQSEKNLLLATASKLGISENSIRLSIVNGFAACTAIEQLQNATRTVFGSEQLPDADLKFFEDERKKFIETISEWCIFIDADTRQDVVRRSIKKSPPHKRKPKYRTDLSGILHRTRNRVKNALKELRKQDIKAQLLSEKVLWNGMPALWITYDTIHPITSLLAVEKIWHQLIAAFAPDRQNIVRMNAIDLLWSSIILVPLVAGKSLEKHALTRFKSVTYLEASALQEHPWQFFPEAIPEDVWQQLGLDHWEVQPVWSFFDRFASAYYSLIHHVEHMSDFNRLPGELDDFGLSILQSYLNHEATRAQPLMQEVLDNCAAILRMFPEIDDHVIESRPNICQCMQILVDMKEAIMPAQDLSEQITLSIDNISDWRDRLIAGILQLGVARYLWIADSLDFGATPDS